MKKLSKSKESSGLFFALNGAIDIAKTRSLFVASGAEARAQILATNALSQSLLLSETPKELSAMWKNINWDLIPNAPSLIVMSQRADAIVQAPFDWLALAPADEHGEEAFLSDRRGRPQHPLNMSPARHEQWVVSNMVVNPWPLCTKTHENHQEETTHLTGFFWRTLMKHCSVDGATVLPSSVLGNVPQHKVRLVDIMLSLGRAPLMSLMLEATTWNNPHESMHTLWALSNLLWRARSNDPDNRRLLGAVSEKHLADILAQSPSWTQMVDVAPYAMPQHSTKTTNKITLLTLCLMGVCSSSVPPSKKLTWMNTFKKTALEALRQANDATQCRIVDEWMAIGQDNHNSLFLTIAPFLSTQAKAHCLSYVFQKWQSPSEARFGEKQYYASMLAHVAWFSSNFVGVLGQEQAHAFLNIVANMRPQDFYTHSEYCAAAQKIRKHREVDFAAMWPQPIAKTLLQTLQSMEADCQVLYKNGYPKDETTRTILRWQTEVAQTFADAPRARPARKM